MRRAHHEPFYVGYHPRAPRGLAVFLRWTAAGALAAATLLGALLGAIQAPLAPGMFEHGVLRPLEGVLRMEPVPSLQAALPGDTSGTLSLLLVGPGKRGVPEEVRRADGRRVRFRGTLIALGATTMAEVTEPASLEVLEAADPAEPPVDRGPVEIEGELVDTKCFLGVMRPGQGKVHRGCAARCLAGGVPPGLLVRDHEGRAQLILLAPDPAAGEPVDPALAGRRLRGSGRLKVVDGNEMLIYRTLVTADDGAAGAPWR